MSFSTHTSDAPVSRSDSDAPALNPNPSRQTDLTHMNSLWNAGILSCLANRPVADFGKLNEYHFQLIMSCTAASPSFLPPPVIPAAPRHHSAPPSFPRRPRHSRGPPSFPPRPRHSRGPPSLHRGLPVIPAAPRHSREGGNPGGGGRPGFVTHISGNRTSIVDTGPVSHYHSSNEG